MSYRLSRYKGVLPVRPIRMRQATRAGHLATSQIAGASSTTVTSVRDVVDLQLVAPPDALSVRVVVTASHRRRRRIDGCCSNVWTWRCRARPSWAT